MKQVYCKPSKVDVTGWNALYDGCRELLLEEGIVLVYVTDNDVVVFQAGQDTDIFINKTIKCEAGSAIECCDGQSWSTMMIEVPIDKCRFPTKEEFDIYESMASI